MKKPQAPVAVARVVRANEMAQDRIRRIFTKILEKKVK